MDNKDLLINILKTITFYIWPGFNFTSEEKESEYLAVKGFCRKVLYLNCLIVFALCILNFKDSSVTEIAIYTVQKVHCVRFIVLQCLLTSEILYKGCAYLKTLFTTIKTNSCFNIFFYNKYHKIWMQPLAVIFFMSNLTLWFSWMALEFLTASHWRQTINRDTVTRQIASFASKRNSQRTSCISLYWTMVSPALFIRWVFFLLLDCFKKVEEACKALLVRFNARYSFCYVGHTKDIYEMRLMSHKHSFYPLVVAWHLTCTIRTESYYVDTYFNIALSELFHCNTCHPYIEQ